MTEDAEKSKEKKIPEPKEARPKTKVPRKDPAKMTFAEHFDELRKRLVRCVISVVVLFIGCWIFREYLVAIIQHPYDSYREGVIASGREDPGPLAIIAVTEKFVFYLKTAFLAAIFISAPVILYQMWLFIGAGLYKKEKMAISKVVPFSILLFLGGLAFGYFVLFPIGMSFLLDFGNVEKFDNNITVSKYCDLFYLLILIVGFMFQAPLIMVVTTKVGLTTPELFSSKRRYFLLGAFICAAMFTPPDPATQCLLAGPLLILFEFGILLSKRVVKKQKARDAERDRPPESNLPPTDKAG